MGVPLILETEFGVVCL